MNRASAFRDLLETIRNTVYNTNVDTDFIWWVGHVYCDSNNYSTLYRCEDLALYLSGNKFLITGTQDRELHCAREFLEILRNYISRQ